MTLRCPEECAITCSAS